MVAFLCSFSLLAFQTFVFHAFGQFQIVTRETCQSIEKIQLVAAKLDATHPLQLTVEDLAKASPLSKPTRRWLRNSRVTIVPLKNLPHQILRPGNSRFNFEIDDSQSWYLATIHLPSGSDCSQSFKLVKADVHMLVVVCK